MKFQGREGLQWWIGVVEDRKDPKFLNRVRVRIYGVHTDDKQLIATPDLPWSQVMMPTTSPSLSGLGTTTHGLVEGSTVVGFYRDALDMQDPVVMGSFIGEPNQYYKQVGETRFHRTPTAGFNDPRLAVETDYEGTPDGKNPDHIKNRDYGLTLALDKSPRGQGGTTAVNYPKTSYAYTSDVNLLARADNLQLSALYPNIAEASGEPARSNYVKPTYPFNHVHETESGHVIELDDTPEYERLHAYHRSGTRVEVDNTGTYIEKIVRDKYTLILGSDTVKIQGVVDIEVGDSITANAIAAAGGSEALAKAAAAGIVDEDGIISASTKQKLLDVGVTEEQITELEAETITKTVQVSAEEAAEGTGEGTGATKTEQVNAIQDAITSTAEKAAEVLTDVETAKENLGIKTVIDTVESVDAETNAGVDSVVKEVSESVGGLTEETEHVIDEFLRGYDDATTTVNEALTDFENTLNNKKDELKDKALEELGVTAVKEKLEEKLTEQIVKIEVLQAEITEKVTEKVTEVATKVLGEELGAKVGEIMTEQMANAVTSVAFSALGGLLGSNLVNISVGGSAKIKTMGSTTLYSYGSTNVTSLMSTKITTLTGDTSLTTLLGTTTVSAPVGMVTVSSPAVNLTAATITSTGIWNHTGAMNITGATNITGVLSGITGLFSSGVIAPIISTGATNLATHTHPIASGSSAGSTLPGVG